jgi:hypothetical protein
MEHSDPVLIPAPSVVRAYLARNLRENRLLRSLLRLSERAAEDRNVNVKEPSREANRQAVAG